MYRMYGKTGVNVISCMHDSRIEVCELYRNVVDYRYWMADVRNERLVNSCVSRHNLTEEEYK
jgi:hypothetical protein